MRQPFGLYRLVEHGTRPELHPKSGCLRLLSTPELEALHRELHRAYEIRFKPHSRRSEDPRVVEIIGRQLDHQAVACGEGGLRLGERF